MGILPKGFGFNFRSSHPIDEEYFFKKPEGCTRKQSPTCKRDFCHDKNHLACNMCSLCMVWNGRGYTYYPGVDQSKQKNFGV